MLNVVTAVVCARLPYQFGGYCGWRFVIRFLLCPDRAFSKLNFGGVLENRRLQRFFFAFSSIVLIGMFMPTESIISEYLHASYVWRALPFGVDWQGYGFLRVYFCSVRYS